MKENETLFKKILYYCNKLFYSYFFPIILLIFFYFFYKFVENNIYVIIIIYVLIILFWMIKLTYIPKNKTKKFGIVFLIDNGLVYDENISAMFNKIKHSLDDDFKIFVFNNNFIKKINCKRKKDKILFKKKYHMVINLYALIGKENSDNVCSLSSENITFIMPYLDDELMKNLEKDFNYSFRKIMKLRENESYVDIKENSEILTLSIRYFVSIIFIIFNELSKATEELDKMNFSNLPTDDKIVQYLRKNSIARYADISYIKIMKIMSKKQYLYDSTELELLSCEEKKFKNIIESISNASNARFAYNDIKSKILYAKHNYVDAMLYLNKMKKKNHNDYGIQLSIAFLYINLCDIKGVIIYNKLSKRRDIDVNIIKDIDNFIDNSMKNESNNIELLLLSKGLLNYYWLDKEYGYSLIKNFCNTTKIDDLKKYIEVRYHK